MVRVSPAPLARTGLIYNQLASVKKSTSAGSPMHRTLRCHHCQHVIGVYEPMIVLTDREARSTSRAAEHHSGEPVGECYHHACYAQAYSQNPDLE